MRLEAERAALAGPTAVTWGAGWSGTGWITGWNDPGQVITFTVSRAAAGPATLRVHYKAPFLAARRDLAIDSTLVASLAFGLTPIVGGDWTSWSPAQYVAVLVTLPAGLSTVTLTRATPGDGPLDLDYVDVEDGAPRR